MSRRDVTRYLAALAAILTGGSAATQQDPTPQQPEKLPAPFILPVGDIAIPQLVDQAARYLRRNILCPPPNWLLGQKSVSVPAPIRVDAAGCEETLIELLFTRRLVLVPLDHSLNLYEVVALDGMQGRRALAAAVWRTPEQILQRPQRKQVTVTVLPLQHISAVTAVDTLRPLTAREPEGPPLSVAPTPDGRGILLSGLQDKVAAAILAVRDTDKPGAPADVSQHLKDRLAVLDQQMAELRAQIEAVQKLVPGKR